MSKPRTLWRCQDCGSTAAKWLGRCPDCGEFNTFVEEKAERAQTNEDRWAFSSEKPLLLSQIETEAHDRFPTGLLEFDRVLGGGIVPGSLILLGGEPGIGKSTLMMQVAGNLALAGRKTLIVSGEESVRQIKLRADRLRIASDSLLLLAEIGVDRIQVEIEALRPEIVIVDSIQTLYHPEVGSAPGSVSQVRECAGQLMRLSKSSGIPIFIVGHVTKEGTIAGPRLLEHMVDVVLYFDGGGHNAFRLVRAVKNRFGAANELAVFSMSARGLAQVDNPSEIFISQRPQGVAGSIVAAVHEGSRPLLVELQALATPSHLSMPRRLASGVDHNRAMLTLAVLERRIGVRLGTADVYINAAGGIKAEEPAIDLPLALAVASAAADKPIPPDVCAFGEVGLAGEIRFVTQIESRIKEAEKLGFKKVVLPSQPSTPSAGIELAPVKSLLDAINLLELI